jgi:hypothetical protein
MLFLQRSDHGLAEEKTRLVSSLNRDGRRVKRTFQPDKRDLGSSLPSSSLLRAVQISERFDLGGDFIGQIDAS